MFWHGYILHQCGLNHFSLHYTTLQGISMAGVCASWHWLLGHVRSALVSWYLNCSNCCSQPPMQYRGVYSFGSSAELPDPSTSHTWWWGVFFNRYVSTLSDDTVYSELLVEVKPSDCIAIIWWQVDNLYTPGQGNVSFLKQNFTQAHGKG